ncbi:hypothetical protein PR048_031200 [Dryococelus australis]|uniref:Uncharacterized protein n=1 Tax=Dryococelus australis TaxID=614101 RepID=A0ABQ9G4L3_9NEOP|nr:hypothetical protein PR048_031200 [Dryococelus australis]
MQKRAARIINGKIKSDSCRSIFKSSEILTNACEYMCSVLIFVSKKFPIVKDLICTVQHHDGNTARPPRMSDEVLVVYVSVAHVAPSLLDLYCTATCSRLVIIVKNRPNLSIPLKYDCGVDGVYRNSSGDPCNPSGGLEPYIHVVSIPMARSGILNFIHNVDAVEGFHTMPCHYKGIPYHAIIWSGFWHPDARSGGRHMATSAPSACRPLTFYHKSVKETCRDHVWAREAQASNKSDTASRIKYTIASRRKALN